MWKTEGCLFLQGGENLNRKENESKNWIKRMKIQQFRTLFLFVATLYMLFAVLLITQKNIFTSLGYLTISVSLISIIIFLILEYKRVFK